jgi:hypothetical protein
MIFFWEKYSPFFVQQYSTDQNGWIIIFLYTTNKQIIKVDQNEWIIIFFAYN